MEECLQHDPRTKIQIKDLLYSFLYYPVRQHFKKQLESLITRNTVLLGATHKSFIYRGVVYSSDTTSPPRRMNRLSPQMIPDMENYIRELKELNDNEIPFVVGYINQVLNSSNNLHDYLLLFPPSIHPPIEKLIASCPCLTKHLTADDVTSIQHKNSKSISLIKQRMATNLLI